MSCAGLGSSMTFHDLGEVEQKRFRNFAPKTCCFYEPNPAQVLMTVSIQYMQRPVDILREAFRVLKPGGILIVSFSNRMFFTKAIEVWRAQRNMKGLVNLVLNYFREACCECHVFFLYIVYFFVFLNVFKSLMSLSTFKLCSVLLRIVFVFCCEVSSKTTCHLGL